MAFLMFGIFPNRKSNKWPYCNNLQLATHVGLREEYTDCICLAIQSWTCERIDYLGLAPVRFWCTNHFLRSLMLWCAGKQRLAVVNFTGTWWKGEETKQKTSIQIPNLQLLKISVKKLWKSSLNILCLKHDKFLPVVLSSLPLPGLSLTWIHDIRNIRTWVETWTKTNLFCPSMFWRRHQGWKQFVCAVCKFESAQQFSNRKNTKNVLWN